MVQATTGPSIFNVSTGPQSTGSRPGEINHVHAAVALGLVGLLALVVGVVNVQIGRRA